MFDVEGDGLVPTKFYVLSYHDGKTIKSLTRHEDMKEWLLNQDVLIAHNSIRWDIPQLERILDIKIKAKLIDSLALSWYLYGEERDRHGLEEWGEDFGIEKPPIKDWNTLPLEVYVHRCEEDVKINLKLWKKEVDYLSRIYDCEENDVVNLPIVSYLSFKLDCAREQERSRWKLDVDKCQSNLDMLIGVKNEKEKAVAGYMPQVAKYTIYSPPAKPFTKSGDLSLHGQNWKNRCEQIGLTFEHTEPIKLLTSYEPPNPSSPQQVKDWLFSLGWEPETFKYVKGDDGKPRAIPQVKKLFEPEFCDSVRALYEKEPALEILEGLSIINHRIGLLNGFLEKQEDGYVKAEIAGFTNTLRFKHIKPCVNLPKPEVLYGKEIRECLVANDGWELCGSDMSSLEDLTKRHYMYPYDPDFVEAMSAPDYDPHLDLAMHAGVLTAQQVENHKKGIENFKSIRQNYKKTNYSGTYKIGKDKLSRELRCSVQEAKKLLDDFWKRNWSIKKVAEDQKVKSVYGNKWLFNPTSGFYYSLRDEKDRFSTLNQSTGVYCFDLWIKEFRKIRPQLTANFHDEVVLCVKKGNREKVRGLLQSSINKVNEKLKLNVKLSIDIKFGENYADVH